ncbi:hypothetical protein [Roseibium polysiphoniae]|uniref:hypothetical protein n=1 Tax=Roseibium polysiphoniae TaxID=2571221 RepID=UPI0032969F50
MKISQAIATLKTIQDTFGDIAITGGTLTHDYPLSNITVTDVQGMQVWPRDPNGVAGTNRIDGVFLD